MTRALLDTKFGYASRLLTNKAFLLLLANEASIPATFSFIMLGEQLELSL